MKNTKLKVLMIASVTALMGISVVAAPMIQDIKAHFNPAIKYHLNGQEVLKEKGALVYKDQVYIPLRDLATTLGVQVDYRDGTVILKDQEAMSFETKTTQIKFQDQTLNLSFELPKEVAPYVTLQSFDESGEVMCLMRFEKDGHIANIGSFSLFTDKDYDFLKTQNVPYPTEVLRQGGIVVGFMGLQDMPFELGTQEARLVETYHGQVKHMLESVKLGITE